MQFVQCQRCGAQLSINAYSCPQCGQARHYPQPHPHQGAQHHGAPHAAYPQHHGGPQHHSYPQGGQYAQQPGYQWQPGYPQSGYPPQHQQWQSSPPATPPPSHHQPGWQPSVQPASAESAIGQGVVQAPASTRDPEAAHAELKGLYRELGIVRDAKGLQERVAELRADAVEAESRLEELKKDLKVSEEASDLQSFGFYRPRYGLDSSDEYTVRLEEVRDRRKLLLTKDHAWECATTWQVDGSASKGRKMVNEHAKLMLRAFNGECDAAVSRVKYNNVVNLEKRIRKSAESINKLGKAKNVTITNAYVEHWVKELHLVHERRERQHEEREEQRRIKEMMREEQKAQKEIEKAEKDALKEEQQYQTALDKARSELAEATGRQHDKLEALVAKLETELSEAIDRKAKAIARAQLTKSGHVYVLSNVGSFGERVYKIGMTRRLEPLERVKELGDASVPFPFDVHAMIYCEDAPGLENALHKRFADRRVNVVNLRREYFRVTLDEIREAVADLHANVTFVLAPEAEEYRKTQAANADDCRAEHEEAE